MRHFKHKILFGLVPILAVCGIVGTSIKDVQQPFAISDKLELNQSNEIYHLNSDTSSISLLFNSSFRAYRHISKSTLTQLKDDMVDAIKDIAKEQIDLVEVFSNNHNSRNYRNTYKAPVVTPYSPVLLFSRSMMAQFVVDGQVRPSAVISYTEGSNSAYANMTRYFVDKYLAQIGPTTENAINAAHEIANIDVYGDGKSLQTYVTQVYTERSMEVPDLGERIYNLYCADLVSEDYHPTMTDITEVYSVVQESLDEEIVTIPNIFESLGRAEVSQDIKDVIASDETTSEQIKDLFLQIETPVLAEVVDNAELTSDEMLDTIEKLGTSNLLEVADAIGIDGLREITSQVSGLDKEALTEFVIDNVTARDMMNATKSLIINGRAIYENKKVNFEELKKFLRDLPRPGQIRNFTDEQMRLNYPVILETSIGPVNFSFTLGLFGDCTNIRRVMAFIDDTFEFHKVDGKYCLTVKSPEKLYKAYQWFCETEAIADDLKLEIMDVLFSTVGEMREYLHNKTLEALVENLKSIDYEVLVETLMDAERWNEIIGHNLVTDARIDRAIDAFFEIVHKVSNQTYEKIRDFISEYIDISSMDDSQIKKLVDKIIDFAKKIDAKNLDHEAFRKFIDPNDDTYTNADVYENIDKLLNYQDIFDKIKNKVLKVFDKLDEKYHDKSIMDYYVGEAQFLYDGTVTIGHDRILSFLKSHLPNKLYEAAKSIVDHIPETISARIDVRLPHVHSVTYMSEERDSATNEVLKYIALPLEANVSFFANRSIINEKSVVKWVYADGSEVDKMPDEDIVVYPVFERQVSVSPDVIERTYDGNATTLTASIAPAADATFEWYKKASSGDVLVGSGETLSLTNVNESGTYYCVAHVGLTSQELTSNEVPVTIKPAVIKTTGHYSWSPSSLSFVYDESAHNIELAFDPSFADAEFITIDHYVIRDANRDVVTEAVNVGSYSTTAYINCDDNHVFTNRTHSTRIEQGWNITKQQISVAGLTPSGQGTYTYSGEEYSFALTGAIPAHVIVTYQYDTEQNHTGFSFTEAGTYEVKVFVSLDDELNYEIIDSEVVEGTYTITINPATIPASAAGFTGPIEFEYDGSAKQPAFEINNPNVQLDGIELFDDNGVQITEAVEPGSYHATARVSSNNPNYVLAKDTYDIDFEIVRIVIVLPELTFEDAEYSYEAGVERSIKLMNGDAEFSDDRFSLQYFYDGEEGTGRTDVGSYQVKAKITLLDTAHYELAPGSQTEYGERTLTINQSDVPGEFNYTYDFTSIQYDGLRHVPALSGYPTEYVRVTSVVVTPENASINAGNYRVTYTLESTNPNYKIPEGKESTYCDYEITKAEITVSEIKWDYKEPFRYDGQMHSVSMISVMPNGVDVIYTGTLSAMEAGSYVVNAKVQLKSSYTRNYELSEDSVTESTLYWEIEDSLLYQFESEQKAGSSPLGIVSIDASKYDGLPDTFALNVLESELDISKIDFSEWFGEEEPIEITGYSVSFLDEDGKEVDIAKYGIMMKVKLYIPEMYRSEQVKLFHLVSPTKVELVESSLVGSYIQFETSHFSDYVLMTSKKPQPKPTEENSNLAAIVISTGTAATALVGFALILFIAKKRKAK